MALFRKLFYRKPPQGLLEISERVYVPDCCFSMDVFGEDKYRDYMEDIVTKLYGHWPDGSFVVFNFLFREDQSQLADVLSEYSIRVMDCCTHFENCPLLTLEMIHHFVKSTISWLDLGDRNVVLLHCEHNGWPVLAFALAALLIYRRQYTEEQQTLEMIYKQAPPQLLQSMTQISPVPSQLRYLQYISGRTLHSGWFPQARSLVVDCIILRVDPIMNADGGFCPIFRIHGLDPLMEDDQKPTLLYSTPKSSKTIQHFKQADCDLVKIDMNCRIKGDVTFECITLDHEMRLEEIMFRIMFNTAFIKSSTLILSSDEIDTPWKLQDQFSTDFQAKVLFSEMVSSSQHSHNLPVEEYGGCQIEASAKDFPRDVDRLDEKDEVEQNIVRTQANFERALASGNYNLDNSSSQSAEVEFLENCSSQVAKEENQEIFTALGEQTSIALESDMRKSHSKVLEEIHSEFSTSSVLNSREMKTHPEKVLPTFLKPVQQKLLLPGMLQSSASSPTSYSLQGLHSPLSRYQNTQSALGITALLHDTPATNKLGSHMVTLSPRFSLSASIPQLCKPATLSLLSMGPPSESQSPFPAAISIPAPPPPPPSSASFSTPIAPGLASLKSSISESSASNELDSHQKKLDCVAHTQEEGYSKTASCPSHSPIPHSTTSLSLTTSNSVPPPRPIFSRRAVSAENLFTSALLSPSLPSSSCCSTLVPKTIMDDTSSILSPCHKIASSAESTSSLITDGSAELEVSPLMQPLPRVNLESDSNNTVKSLPPPSFTLSNISSFSSQSISSSTSSLSLLTATAPTVSDIASSSGHISSVVPGKEVERTTLPSVVSVSLLIATSTSLVPPAALPAQSPTSCSLRDEALSPALNSCSTLLISPDVVRASISSLPPEKSFDVAAKPPPPPPSPLHSSKLSNSAAPSSLPTHPPPSGPPNESTARTSTTSLLPPSAPTAQSPASQSLREALLPALDSCSTLVASPGVASLHASLSSLPREKISDAATEPPRPPPPPPSPIHSSKLSNSAASPSLPPPPPPSGPPRESTARAFSKIPPPPAPFSSGLTKAGSTLQSKCSGGNGIPPTPAPPEGAKGRLPTGKPQSHSKRSSLKPYHWLKLTRALQGSIWAETWNPDEASKTPEFDMSELESLFSVTSISDHGSTKCKSNRASKSKPDKVNLIDFRRAYNCEIMLTKIKIPLPDIMSSVLSLDDSALDADQVENVIKFCPKKEEIELLKNYKGDTENLGKCEQFLLEMMKVPRAELKLRVFSFKIQFQSRVSDLRRALNLINSASLEVRNSIKLKRVMQTILSLGNVLNHGTARGSAIGFRLDSLLKLSETRAHNNKMTLMHYLCKVLAEKLPELLDFPKDLMSLEGTTKIQLKYLAEEMQTISKGLEKVTQELTASENDGPVSESFTKTLKEFLLSAEAEVRSLALLYSVVGKNADALAQYFGEDPVRCPFEQVVSTLLNFVRMFIKAHEENCKQFEFEKKRAEKERASHSSRAHDRTELSTNFCNVSQHSTQQQ